MAMRRRHHRRATAILLVALAAACSGDDPVAPRLGVLQLTVETSGGDIDVDGYDFVVGARRQPVFASGTARFSDLAAGTHLVTMEKVAENCAVSGLHPRTVTVSPGDTVHVAFEVVCSATGIAVTTRTTGVDTPDRYQVLLNDRPAGPVFVNDSLLLGRLQPGTYTVALDILADNCSVVGGARKTVDVIARSATPVLFEVSCVAPVRLEKIAFVGDTIVNGVLGSVIRLIRPDGTGVVPVGLGHSPAWSPDGTKLVFSTTQCDFYYGQCTGGLVVLDPETRKVTTTIAGTNGTSPAWAPTGDVIAFARCCESYYQPSRLFLVAPDGSADVELAVPGVLSASDPDWSPDGQRIAFTCVVDYGNVDLCMADRDGTGFVRLTNGAGSEHGPTWNREGDTIAFTSYTGQRLEIALMRVDDRHVSPLTDGWDPAWSRDGRKLVFATGIGLYTIDADGSNRARLTAGGQRGPAWRP